MTLSDCLEANGLLPKYIISPDLFLLFAETERDLGLRLSNRLRKAGHSTSYSLKAAGFGKQFKDAGKSGARYAIILGEDEVERSEVKVKDLRSGLEENCKITELVDKIEYWDGEGGISE